MYKNRKFGYFLAGSLLLFLTSCAFALQDAARWSGYYVGADVGGAFCNVKMQTSVAPNGTYFNYTQDAPQLYAAYNDNSSLWHIAGGVLAGYEHPFNPMVVGVEASLNSLSLNHSQSTSEVIISDPNILFTASQTLKASWQGTLRLKLGFAKSRWLAYLTGGPAMTSLKYTSSYNDNNSQPGLNLPGALGIGNVSKTKYGWTLGVGGEYAINNYCSLNIKYLYSNFGTVRTAYNLVPTPTLSEFTSEMDAKAALTAQSVLVGLTYRFA